MWATAQEQLPIGPANLAGDGARAVYTDNENIGNRSESNSREKRQVGIRQWLVSAVFSPHFRCLGGFGTIRTHLENQFADVSIGEL
jgi:hypothetical protein